MRLILSMLAAALILLTGRGVQAEIYIWTDADGVKHYSNTPPPADAEVFERRGEMRHDAESHQQRLSEEQASFEEFQEAEAQRVREERQLELIRQQQAAQVEAAQAAQRAEAAAKEAAAAAEAARDRSSGYVVLPPRHWFPRPKPYYPPHPYPEPRRPREHHHDDRYRDQPSDRYAPGDARRPSRPRFPR
ncbi:MAG: DUF4124 domain-containing protein [Desulfobacterales bacterium]